MYHYSRLKGGIYGLLVGDALGVPYEFHSAEEIPDIKEIEMQPPKGFRRSHGSVAPATWSDDGAQALCLMDSLTEVGHFDLVNFSDKLLKWYDEGLWAVGGNVFDVGIQTSMALNAYRSGEKPEICGMIRPDGKGNGALMRVLPLAFFHSGDDASLAADAHAQCLITHGNITNQVCCALYCLIASELIGGSLPYDALKNAVARLRKVYEHMPEYSQEFESSIRPDEPGIWQGRGSGYVVDSLRSAVMIMLSAKSYEEAVKTAIALGDDTDTTACITGGLAGIFFGEEGIPSRWLESLCEKERADELTERFIGILRRT